MDGWREYDPEGGACGTLEKVPITMYLKEENDNSVVWYRWEEAEEFGIRVYLFCVKPDDEMFQRYGEPYTEVDCRGDRCRKRSKRKWCTACFGDSPDSVSSMMPDEIEYDEIRSRWIEKALTKSFTWED